MEYKVRILDIKMVARNVKAFRIEKPQGYSFIPGQATEVSIDKSGWENEKRPFTFTSLNEQPFLEFTIKSYKDHNGVTNALDQLKVNDSLIIGDVWGAIEYKGPGYFIAGGAGITPFIAILRYLNQKNETAGNRLFFSNRGKEDIIYEEELANILGRDNVIFTLTDDDHPGYDHYYINKDFLNENIKDFKKHFYICGPEAMTSQINDTLISFGVTPDEVVFEK
jgi:glycine betaine catabolism B